MGAGLPNIFGYVGGCGHKGTISGAFYTAWDNGYGGGTGGCFNAAINASRSSTLYGSSETVTPLSKESLFLIKY